MTTARVPNPRRRTAIVATVALAVVAAIVGWRLAAPNASSAAAEPTYQRVTLSTFIESVPAPGTLQPWRSAELRSATGGTVAWTVEAGDRVEAGEIVAQLDTVPLERSVQDARLALERAQRQLVNARQDQIDTERVQRSAVEQAERRVADADDARRARIAERDLAQRLVGLGSETEHNLRVARDAVAAAERELDLAGSDLADARADAEARAARAAQDVLDAAGSLDQAEVTLQRALEDLEAATLRATFAGVVDAVDAPEGSVVSANGLVLSIADDARLQLATQVDETEVGRVSVGLPATVTVTAIPDQVVRADVVRISTGARTVQNIPVFDVTLEVPNPTLALRPGMTAEAEIVLREVEGTFSVPSRAVDQRTQVVGTGVALDASRRDEALRAAGLPDGASPDDVRAAVAAAAAGGVESGAAMRGALEAAAGGRGVAGTAVGGLALAGRSEAGRLGTVQVRTADGSVRTVEVEVIATVGATVVLRGDLPEGAEVEVPPVAAATTATATGRLPFGLGGGGGGGGAIQRMPGGF
jgi:HlyD family secretion protein